MGQIMSERWHRQRRGSDTLQHEEDEIRGLGACAAKSSSELCK
jgi:hypothetical protein